jgi:hypothetical protein
MTSGCYFASSAEDHGPKNSNSRMAVLMMLAMLRKMLLAILQNMPLLWEMRSLTTLYCHGN